MDDPSPTRSRLPRAERELQILETARALFAERGFGAVTMDDVAARVGVTKPLLYAYFGNKDHLYIACMQPAGDAMLATVAEAVRATSAPADALREGLHAFFAFVESDRDSWRVLFDETLPAGGEIAQRVGEYRERLVAMIAEARLATLPSHSRERAAPETEALSAALLGASEALARWWLRTGAISSLEAAELLIATVEPGLIALGERSARARSSEPEIQRGAPA